MVASRLVMAGCSHTRRHASEKSTRAPFEVGADELDLVRTIEITDPATGTKVHARLVADDPRSGYFFQGG